jgi:exopolysaccharide biosynthesis protein
METVKVLAVDPSLRNTGLAIVTYNAELPSNDPKAFLASHCQVLCNPIKYKGTEAILNMLDMICNEAKKYCYQNVDNIVIESPPIMFNKAWSSGVISSIAHIAGGAAVAFDIENTRIFRPNEWNKTRKKEVTHSKTIDFLGDPDTWQYEKRVKSQKLMEHILDAVSMGLWYINQNYLEE